MWSCDDFCTTKSDPGIYLAAAERLGAAPSDVVFLDDNIIACRTAMAAGIYTVGIYDPSGESFTEELKRECDLYVTNLSELK